MNNKEELINDLNNLIKQKNNIEGAINYIVQKLKKLEEAEKTKKEEELKEAEK